jgi:ADP-ribosylglycohydrolase
MNLQDRVLGCLGGLTMGDSLGAATEFLTRSQIEAEFGQVERLVQAPAWHPHARLQAGQVTDDTGQVLAIAHALGSDGQTTAEDVARSLLKWADEMGDDLDVIVGPSTRQALERLRNGESPRTSGRDGTTNGASYRGIIPGLMNYDQPQQLLPQVVEVCLPTHGTSVAISGAAAVAFAVAQALSEAPCLEGIIAAAEEGARSGRQQGVWAWGTALEKRIQLALRLVAENPQPEQALAALSDYVGSGMLVAESVACAFGVVVLAKGDPMQAIHFGANLGGDTDTIAALAGAICGAWRGAASLDRDMLLQVEEVNQMDLAAEAAHLVGILEKRKSL